MMKSRYIIFGFLACLIALTSCLKDENVTNQKYGMMNESAFKVVEIPSGSGPRGVSLVSKDEQVNLDMVSLHLSAENPANEDIVVTLTSNKSQEVINKYNTDNGTSYELLPLNLYQLPNGLNATILKGTRDATLKLIINAIDLDPSKTYAIVFGIESVDKQGYTISGNFNQELITVSVKNQWHAKYKVTGFCFHPTAPRPINDEKELTTLGPITLNAPLGDLYGAGYYFKFDVNQQNTLTNWLNLGSTPASFALLSTDNPSGTIQTKAAIDYGAVIGQGEWVSTKYNNTYDPAIKTFWLHYSYMGGNGAREFYEKWVRID